MRFAGTPEEIGRGRGEVYGSMLREAYSSFITYTGAEKARAEKQADSMRVAVERSFPDFARMLEATATASGMGYSEMISSPPIAGRSVVSVAARTGLC